MSAHLAGASDVAPRHSSIRSSSESLLTNADCLKQSAGPWPFAAWHNLAVNSEPCFSWPGAFAQTAGPTVCTLLQRLTAASCEAARGSRSRHSAGPTLDDPLHMSTTNWGCRLELAECCTHLAGAWGRRQFAQSRNVGVDEKNQNNFSLDAPHFLKCENRYISEGGVEYVHRTSVREHYPAEWSSNVRR